MHFSQTCISIIFDLNELAILVNKIEPTKRQIVTVTTRFYDLLGFISPVVINFKTIVPKDVQEKTRLFSATLYVVRTLAVYRDC